MMLWLFPRTTGRVEANEVHWSADLPLEGAPDEGPAACLDCSARLGWRDGAPVVVWWTYRAWLAGLELGQSLDVAADQGDE